MKTAASLACLFCLFCSPLTASAQSTLTTASSRVDSVTVFSDRAQVTRKGVVALQPGTNLVTIEGLPQLMAEESLRVQGEGQGHTRISGVTVRKVFLSRVQEKRVHELEDEITALNRKVESLDARRKGLSAQETFLESIKVGWGERISKELALGKPSTSEMGEAARFVGEGVSKVEEQLYDAEAAKKPLLEKIAALKKELEQTNAARMKEVRAVQVAIEAERETRFNLELRYLVSQAHWVPTYDVRLLSDGKEAELTYRAQTWQKSGEEWPDVKLTLSTAKPEVGGAPPELVPWHVSFYEPPRPLPYATMAAAPSPVLKGRRAVQPEDMEQTEQAVPESAQVEEGQTSVAFNVRQPVDVPTDGTRVGSVIAIDKLPVTPEYVTVPKLSPRVYLKSEVLNDTPYPLLAGEANIFNDTVFTGKTFLKTVASGEKFDLYFGADDRIKVKRDMERVKKGGGLLSGNSISYHCTIELQNFKKQPVTVMLQDQLPLAGNEEIKVKLEEASQKPQETKQDGTMVWKVNLAPGEKRKVSYDIVIEYPKGKELTGIQ